MNGDDTRSGDWSDWRNLVLYELDEMTKAIKRINEQQSEFLADIRVLKVKAAFFGGIGGVITLLVGQFILGG